MIVTQALHSSGNSLGRRLLSRVLAAGLLAALPSAARAEGTEQL